MTPEALLTLGLTRHEADIYLALLDTGQTTAGKLAEILSLHRRSVYDALESLQQRGRTLQAGEHAVWRIQRHVRSKQLTHEFCVLVVPVFLDNAANHRLVLF